MGDARKVSSAGSATQRFPIRVGSKSRPLLLLFGVRRNNAYVDLGTDLDAHFGFYRMRTPVANIHRWQLEGPWLWLTAVGVRRGIRHGDLTFGGNHHGGVRLDFREPVRWGPLTIPTLYVTVADMEGLAAVLTARGIAGEDARKSR